MGALGLPSPHPTAARATFLLHAPNVIGLMATCLISIVDLLLLLTSPIYMVPSK